MSFKETQSIQSKIPMQMHPEGGERQRTQRPAEFIAMDRFWNEVVPACKEFHSTLIETEIPITNPLLFRSSLYTHFGLGRLSDLYDQPGVGTKQTAIDRHDGVRNKITRHKDGLLEVNLFVPNTSGQPDTVDLFYEKLKTCERLRIETKETMSDVGKDKAAMIERRRVELAFYTIEPRYSFQGAAGERSIFASFQEEGTDVWGTIS